MTVEAPNVPLTQKLGSPQMFLVSIGRKRHPQVYVRVFQCETWQGAVKLAYDDLGEHEIRLASDPQKHNDDYKTVSEMATTLYLLTGTGLSVCVVRPAVLDVKTGYALEHDISPVSATHVRVIAEVIELDRETIYDM